MPQRALPTHRSGASQSLSPSHPAATGEYVAYGWDYRSRLVRVEYRTPADVLTKRVEYDYDALDRRVAKRVDDDGDGVVDRAERYAYDGAAGKIDPKTGTALDDVVLVFDGAGALTGRHLHGPGVDQVLAGEGPAGEVLWALADNQGTVRDVAGYDSAADATSVANHLTYDAFGRIASETNGAVEFRYAYTGREWDEDAQLQYSRHRWYDPAVGRWISEDPIAFAAGDMNLMRYVGNSSPNEIDPAGMDAINHWDGSHSTFTFEYYRGLDILQITVELWGENTDSTNPVGFFTGMDGVINVTVKVVPLGTRLPGEERFFDCINLPGSRPRTIYSSGTNRDANNLIKWLNRITDGKFFDASTSAIENPDDIEARQIHTDGAGPHGSYYYSNHCMDLPGDAQDVYNGRRPIPVPQAPAWLPNPITVPREIVPNGDPSIPFPMDGRTSYPWPSGPNQGGFWGGMGGGAMAGGMMGGGTFGVWDVEARKRIVSQRIAELPR